MLRPAVSVSGTKLKAFLGASGNTEADLILPKFAGGKQMSGVEMKAEFTYPGSVYSDRDTRSAFYISNLLGHVLKLDNINLRDTFNYNIDVSKSKLVFVFGSRSNQLTESLFQKAENSEVFGFEFGDTWKIHSHHSGKTYSIADPSTLSRPDYEASTDFGLIARFLPESANDRTTFVIAGLGSRATEGCGIYFATYWQQMNEHFGKSRIAAVILKFPPPVDPKVHAVAEWLTK